MSWIIVHHITLTQISITSLLASCLLILQLTPPLFPYTSSSFSMLTSKVNFQVCKSPQYLKPFKDSPALTECISLTRQARCFLSGFCLLVKPHLLYTNSCPFNSSLTISIFSPFTWVIPCNVLLCFVYLLIVSRLNSRASSSMKPFCDSSQNSHVAHLQGITHIVP